MILPSGKRNTPLEKCLGKSENVDIAMKYQQQEQLTNDEQDRLITCTQQVEATNTTINITVISICGVFVAFMIGLFIWEFRA